MLGIDPVIRVITFGDGPAADAHTSMHYGHSHARDGRCAKPCCTVGPYGAQVHHAAKGWSNGGQTNIDELGLACGPDNRMVGDGGRTTAINAHGQVEWIPPPQLDTGQTRVNDYHHPERLLKPDADEPDPADDG